MKNIAKILICVLLTLTLAASFTACSKKGVPDGYQLVAREGDEFRLFVPTQGWMPNINSGMTSAYFAVTNDEVGMPAASVSVYVADDAEGCETLAAYWEVCRAKLQAQQKDFVLEREEGEELTLGGEAALRYTYTATKTVYVSEENGRETVEAEKDISYKFMHIIAMHGGDMYVMIFSAPAEEYERRVTVMDPSIDDESLGIIGNFRFDAPYSPEKKKELVKSEAPEGMKVASVKGRPYVFFCQTAWEIDTSAEMTVVKADDGSNVTAMHIMPSLEPVPSLSEYWKSCAEKYSNVMTDFVCDKTEECTVGGVENGMVGTFSGKSGGISYKFKQAIAYRKGVFYVVTYTATEENFDRHIDDADAMIENFDING